MFLAALVVSSCARSRIASPAENSDPEKHLGPKREITLRKEESTPRLPAPRVGTAQNLLPLESSAHIPEDFKIGSLQDTMESDRDLMLISERVMGFLNSLKSAELVNEQLLPSKREELSRFLNFYLEQDLYPLDFRMGTTAISVRDGQKSARLNVRLFGAIGVTEGELYLSMEDQKWYISDIQVGFELLRQPYSPSEERFVPSEYGWALSGT